MNFEKEKNVAIQKRIDAEIKAAAVKEGLIDLDLIKLMEKEKVQVDLNGDPVGIEELLNEFKQRKPAYFSDAKQINSSTNAQVPKKELSSTPISAWDMSKDEFSKRVHQITKTM